MRPFVAHIIPSYCLLVLQQDDVCMYFYHITYEPLRLQYPPFIYTLLEFLPRSISNERPRGFPSQLCCCCGQEPPNAERYQMTNVPDQPRTAAIGRRGTEKILLMKVNARLCKTAVQRRGILYRRILRDLWTFVGAFDDQNSRTTVLIGDPCSL